MRKKCYEIPAFFDDPYYHNIPHEQYVEEGVNTNGLSKIIRNDEIEKLQEISSETNFDFNQTIPKSLYERFSFINQENVTLIDYAAFFSSVKCFKYLLINGAKLENTGKYAIAGGNEEIIHLCEQNHSSFKDAYETAIMFHRNDIFHYLYDNKIGKYQDLDLLGYDCILWNNYELFLFLRNKGMNIICETLKTAIEYGNTYLTSFIIEKYSLINDVLQSAVLSINPDTIIFLLQQKEISTSLVRFEHGKALVLAATYGKLDIVKLLMKQEGIHINIKDKNGKVALNFASREEIVSLFCKET